MEITHDIVATMEAIRAIRVREFFSHFQVNKIFTEKSVIYLKLKNKGYLHLYKRMCNEVSNDKH